MLTKKGIPVSPGIAIFPAVVLDAGEHRVPKRTVALSEVPKQQERLQEALKAGVDELQTLRQQTANDVGEEFAKIFDVHIGMLGDPQFVGQIESTIEGDRVTAEYAVYHVVEKLADTFAKADSPYMRERATDLWDLQKRIVRLLVGDKQISLKDLDHQCVIVAHDLTPSQTASLDKTKIKGLATDAGGRTSHTAILAHALGIPAIVGLEDITAEVATGDNVVIDGDRGVVVVEPDAERIMQFREAKRRNAEIAFELAQLKAVPSITRDGTEIDLLANIEFPSEITEAVENGAVGVGLYRTEFIYLAAEHEPTEEEQYETYLRAIRALDGKPLTIRTLDLGADKFAANVRSMSSHAHEPNPFLGCRSIRLCLQDLPLFKTQLRAILRASVEGPVKIMFPLISNVMELRQAKMILSDVMEDLDDQGIPYRDNIPVGMMIEVPSAALQAKTFAREVDFFSVGTNDLVQYTVAVDRSNERIANLYSAANPAVVALIKDVIRAANRANIEVSLCGEMAGEVEYTMLLLGLGLRRFSITPPAIPEVKSLVRAVSIDQCQRIARKAGSFDSDREVLNYLRDQVNRILPDSRDGRSIG